MSNVIQLNTERNTPDYTLNREDAQELVNRLMDYYHRRGHRNVKVWLEPNEQFSGRRFWDIRSNIVFRVQE